MVGRKGISDHLIIMANESMTGEKWVRTLSLLFVTFTNFGSYFEKILKYKKTEEFQRSPRSPRDCFAEKGSQDEKDPPNQSRGHVGN